LLADVVSKGGNLLLNIGPKPDATFPTEACDRLKEIGNWMKVNSEAIYNTKGMTTFGENKFRFTQDKDGKVYAIYLAEEGELKIPSELVITAIIPRENSKIHILGYDQNIKWEKLGNGIVIHIPQKMQMNPPSSYAWVFSISQ
jgi:alpha-L-fucosidase